MSLGEARIKEEAECEVTGEDYVKLEAFCADSSCDVSEAAMEGLYADHVVKDELVLGPECVQQYPACGDSNSTGLSVGQEAIPVRLYANHVIKEEHVLGPVRVQRFVPRESYESLTVLEIERSVPCVATHPDTAPALSRADAFLEGTAHVAPRATNAGTSQPQPSEIPVNPVPTQLNTSEKIPKKESFLSKEEIDELLKNKPSILEDLTKSDKRFVKYFRVSQEQFAKVLKLIEHDLRVLPCSKYPKAEILAVTLRYLATGEDLHSLSLQHRIYYPDLSKILPITFQAVCKHLKPIYLPQVTKERLANVAKEFWSKWNFPNCCGALEGKHCSVRASSQSVKPNDEVTSVVLIGLVDADGKFIRVDIGLYGTVKDRGVFSKSALGKQIECGICGGFPFPADAKLPGSDVCFPHYVVGGKGFKLLRRLMTPYCSTRKVKNVVKLYYNEQLNRARSTAESAFSALTNTFKVFLNIIQLEMETVQFLILASCCLHNMLMENGHSLNMNYNVSESNLIPLRTAFQNPSRRAFALRNELKDYLNIHKERDLTKLENWQSVEENLTTYTVYK